MCYGRLPRQTRAETSAEPRSDLATVRPACTHSHRRGSLRRALRAAMDDEAIAAPRCVRTAFERLDFRLPQVARFELHSGRDSFEKAREMRSMADFSNSIEVA